MKNPVRTLLTFLTVLLLGLVPAVVPVGGSVAPAEATTDTALMRFDATNSSSYGGSGTIWTSLSGQDPSGGTLTAAGRGSPTPAFDPRSKSFTMETKSSFNDDHTEFLVESFDGDFTHGYSAFAVVDFGQSAQNYERIFDFGRGEALSNIYFGRYGTTDRLETRVYPFESGSPWQCLSVEGAIQPGFHQYQVSVSADGTCVMKRDGITLTTTTSGDLSLPNTKFTSNKIGQTNWESGTWREQEYLEGSIQSLIVYNSAKTTPECVPEESTFTGNGTIGTNGTPYQVLTFTTVGSCEWVPPAGVTRVESLLVAGGGGGGGHIAGGGGGGEATEVLKNNLSSNSTYEFSVGAGGAGGIRNWINATYNGENGLNTSAFAVAGSGAVVAAGGGGGGTLNFAGESGGSGGGTYLASGSGVPAASSKLSGGFGNAGGIGSGGGSAAAVAGGGGGAGMVGSDSSGQSGGAGGVGKEFTITGVSTDYAGGGGGGVNGGLNALSSGSAGAGGVGGGGAGGAKSGTMQGVDGTANLGGGGGGSTGNGSASTSRGGGHGGSGVIILRYTISPEAPTISSVTAGDTTVSVTFSAPAHTGGSSITRYEYSFDGSAWVSFGSATAGTKTISSLNNGTAYTVRVRAVNSSPDGASVTAGSAVTPRAAQTMTWAPTNTFLDWDSGNVTSLTFDAVPTVLGAVAVTYSESSSQCSIPDPSAPTVTITGVGDCVVTATSAQGAFTQATSTVTLTVFDGAGSGNVCDQNVSGLTLSTLVDGNDCVFAVKSNTGSSGTWVVPNQITEIDLLLVAGGGGGGSYGGGGAGELLASGSVSLSSPSYAITVGGGGTGYRQEDGVAGVINDGGDTSFGGTSVNGGGAGGAMTGARSGTPGRVGGSGGGGGTQNSGGQLLGGASQPTASGLGHAGGSGNPNAANLYAAGGGGGAGGPGGNGVGGASLVGGRGGDGAPVSIVSTAQSTSLGAGVDVSGAVIFAAGGVGGANGIGSVQGAAGLGGVGNYVAVPANSGGGGSGSASVYDLGESGGSGVVIVRYTRIAQATLTLSVSDTSLAYTDTATLSVSGGSGTGALTYASDSAGCTIVGTTLTADSGTGSCAITATQAADVSYVSAVSSAVTVTLSKADQSALSISVNDSTLAFGETGTLSHSGGSSSGAVTYTVASGDCSVTGTTVTVTGGTTDCSITAVMAGNDNYNQVSAATPVTISVSGAVQTITFGGLSGKTYGDAAFSVSGSSSSGLTLAFSSDTTAVCTVSGTSVTIVAAGTCTVRATQAGNTNYSAANAVTQGFTVSAKVLTMSVVVASKVYDQTTSATVSGTPTLTGVVAGDAVSVDASQVAVVFANKTVGVNKATTVSFSSGPLIGVDAGNYSISAPSGVTGAVSPKSVTVDVTPAGKTYDGTQTATVASSSMAGTIAGDTVNLDANEISVVFVSPGAGTRAATVTLGSGVLNGTDAGNYVASVGTVSNATIAKATQASVSLVSATSIVFGQSLTLVGSGGSGSGVLSYAKVSGPCAVASGVVTPSGAGTCVVTATRAADDNFNVATSSNVSITVAQAPQSVNFTSTVPASIVSGTQYTPVATATSSLTVTFSITSGSPGVCGLAGGVVTFVASGTCVIQAAQAGNSDYVAAPSVTQTLVAGKINQTLSFPAIAGKDFDDPAFLAGASVSTSRAVTYATSTSGVCGVNSTTGLINIITTGTCTVTASSAGDPSYAAASDVSRSFTISPVVAGTPSITSVSFGDSSVTVAFIAPGFVGGDAIDAYQVVATASGGVVTKPDCATTSPCTITGLTNGVSYTLTVAALNAAGVGPASTASPAVTPATIPDAVSALSTTPGNTQLVVDWSQATSFGGGTFTRYEVSVRVRGNSWGTPVSIPTVNTETYTFTGLSNGTAYDVKLVTISSANGSELSSNTATALGVPATAPDAPTALTVASTSNTTAVASWSAPSDDGGAAISAYGVSVACSFAVATDTFCSVTGLTAGSTVTVTIGATNLMGTGTTVSVSITMPGASGGGSNGSSGGSSGGGSGGGSGAAGGAGTSPTSSPRTPGNPRVIVPTIPAASPVPVLGPVVTPGRGFDPSVGTRATIGGAPATVTKTTLTNGGMSVQAGQVQLSFSQPSAEGSSTNAPGNASSNGDLSVPRGKATTVSGSGLLPGSQVQFFLPGRSGSSRELARVVVGAGGQFDAPVSMETRQFETPVPIGPQVMQIVGYDAQGNQTVVDMVINIGQGAPAPELNRLENALPVLAGGQSLGTSGGAPEVMEIIANEANSTVVARSDSWSFTVDVADTEGEVQAVPSGASITLVQSSVAVISGEGFQSGTRVDVWLFSEPTLLGSVTVADEGTVLGEFFLDPRFAGVGSHTLQLQGVGVDGFIKAANLGVSVVERAVVTSSGASVLLWSVVGVSALLLVALFVGVALRARRRRA